MEKIKFSKDKGSLFYKDLRKQVDQYFSDHNIQMHGNVRMKFKIFLYFGLDILFYSLMLNTESQFAFITYYILMGISVLLTAFNISHDAAHGVAVKSKFWNKLLFQLSFNLQGNNAYVWGKHHNESHHLYTNVEGSDIDILNNPIFRMTATQKLKWFHKFQWLYAPFIYLFYSLNWFLVRDTALLFNLSSRTIQVKIPFAEAVKLLSFKLLYIGYMIVLPAMILPFDWKLVLLTFILNHFVVSIIFISVLGVSHVSDYVSHPLTNDKNELNMSWPTLQMRTSVDYSVNSKLFNWTLGGFNAHSLHHLLPNVSHVHYLNLLPIFSQLAEKHEIIHMEMPYFQSLKAHFRQLKRMGSQLNPQPRSYER